jgi:hypothetical protein
MAAPKDNSNAEKWDIDTATQFMEDSLMMSTEKEGEIYSYDFIGELARDMQQYKEVFGYISTKFKELKTIHNKIISNCESNCFYNGKKNNIVPSMAIMNLKSNHGWTDRLDQTTKDEKIESSNPLTSDQVDKLLDKL